MAPKHVVFLGPPGTGKGTQAVRLEQRCGWKALSSGDMMRAEIAAGSELGNKAAEYVNNGRLVPDEIITGVILGALDRVPKSLGWVLDGFPRTVPQAEALDKGLLAEHAKIDAVVNLDLDDHKIVERLITRRICKECGALYNIRFQPPRQDGVCDRCGGEVVQRADDREDVIRTRLATYREQTAPLIAYYTQRGLLQSVDADDTVEKVQTAIEQALGCGKQSE